MFHACSSSRINQLTIPRVINRLGIIVALSGEGMGCRQHLLDPLAGAQKCCWIAQITTHHFCPLLLQMNKIGWVSGHQEYCFALRKQTLGNSAAEATTGTNY